MAKVPHLTRLWGQWYSRRAVPADLRQIVGKREVKYPVGHDYAQAVARVRLHGVETDVLFEQARRKLDRITRATATDDEVRGWVLVWFHEAERRAQKANLAQRANSIEITEALSAVDKDEQFFPNFD